MVSVCILVDFEWYVSPTMTIIIYLHGIHSSIATMKKWARSYVSDSGVYQVRRNQL